MVINTCSQLAPVRGMPGPVSKLKWVLGSQTRPMNVMGNSVGHLKNINYLTWEVVIRGHQSKIKPSLHDNRPERILRLAVLSLLFLMQKWKECLRIHFMGLTSLTVAMPGSLSFHLFKLCMETHHKRYSISTMHFIPGELLYGHSLVVIHHARAVRVLSENYLHCEKSRGKSSGFNRISR